METTVLLMRTCANCGEEVVSFGREEMRALGRAIRVAMRTEMPDEGRQVASGAYSDKIGFTSLLLEKYMRDCADVDGGEYDLESDFHAMGSLVGGNAFVGVSICSSCSMPVIDIPEPWPGYFADWLKDLASPQAMESPVVPERGCRNDESS